MKPPPMIDGAKVLWWAWSGDEPFGEHYGDEGDDRWVHGFAVCQYESGQFYRFSCNRHWECVNDTDAASIEKAKASIPMNYDESRIVWQPYAP